MTENKMKEKWCPHGRMPDRDYESYRAGEQHSTPAVNITSKGKRTFCFGSECAMWEPLINDCGMKPTAQEKLRHLLTFDAPGKPSCRLNKIKEAV